MALVQLLPSRLTGSAFLLWDSLPTETKNDFGMVKRKLSNIFSKKDEVSSFRSVLTARPRLSREPLEVYVAALRRLTLAAFPHFDSTAMTMRSSGVFLSGSTQTSSESATSMGQRI